MKRIFISFAIEDKNYRDLLVGQAKNANSPFEFVDMSVKEPWATDWKERCRSKIKSCHGVIALLSRDTPRASGALWEMECADEENIPMIGVYVSDNDRPATQITELIGHRIITWTWDGIRNFINAL